MQPSRLIDGRQGYYEPGIGGATMTDVFSSLNSLIWLLIVILIIAAVVLVIRAVMAPGPREPYDERTVVQQPVVQPPPQPPAPTSGGLAPGWYPDQNDPDSMRYYDGRTWTSQTQPRS
jgi:Protein of unknown function (DUF2510)